MTAAFESHVTQDYIGPARRLVRTSSSLCSLRARDKAAICDTSSLGSIRS